MRAIGLFAVMMSAAAAVGGECGAPHATSVRVGAAPSIVALPFAVPVAVPVATVRLPTVLYSYREALRPQATREPAAAPVSAEAALRIRCAECHQGAEASGGLAIFDDAGKLRAKLPRQRMWERIDRGEMPPNGTLGEDEKRLLAEWARPPRELEY